MTLSLGGQMVTTSIAVSLLPRALRKVWNEIAVPGRPERSPRLHCGCAALPWEARWEAVQHTLATGGASGGETSETAHSCPLGLSVDRVMGEAERVKSLLLLPGEARPTQAFPCCS